MEVGACAGTAEPAVVLQYTGGGCTDAVMFDDSVDTLALTDGIGLVFNLISDGRGNCI
jgi:hypothetical protein